jgi:hypothetical protein
MTWNEMNEREKREFLVSIVQNNRRSSSSSLKDLEPVIIELRQLIDALMGVVFVIQSLPSAQRRVLH